MNKKNKYKRRILIEKLLENVKECIFGLKGALLNIWKEGHFFSPKVPHSFFLSYHTRYLQVLSGGSSLSILLLLYVIDIIIFIIIVLLILISS